MEETDRIAHLEQELVRIQVRLLNANGKAKEANLRLQQLTAKGPAYTHFVEFFKDGRYPYTTLEQKVTVYLQHLPKMAVPLLLELITNLYPDSHGHPGTD